MIQSSPSVFRVSEIVLLKNEYILRQSGKCYDINRHTFWWFQCSSVEAPYIARHTALRIGCDVDTPALTVNRLCGSGFQSIVNGAHVSGIV